MKWNLDAAHSNVGFSVRHMGFSTVRGSFNEFSVEVETDDAFAPTRVTAQIPVTSINTANENRDAHLASADFFDAENHPNVTFESTNITKTGTNTYDIEGTLSMAGHSQPFTLHTEIEGPITDPWGKQRLSSELSGTFKRSEWGLTWNQALEAGGFLVSDDVKFDIALQVVEE